MRRLICQGFAIGLAAASVITTAAMQPPKAGPQTPPVSFNRDVLPILQHNCQSCHRSGEIAPMSFLNYESTRPWAKAIKAAVLAKKMPPWFADPQHGRFKNDRSLAPRDIDTIVRWVDEGAALGSGVDVAGAVDWPTGWRIAPDVVISAPAYDIPASGMLEWAWIVMPSGFAKDTWVTSIEVRPSAREVVHHVVVFTQPHSPKIPHNVIFWDQKQRDKKGVASGQPIVSSQVVSSAGDNLSLSDVYGNVAAIYVPGGDPLDFRVHGAGQFVPANSDIVLQIHYTTVGKPVTEVTRIGFTVAAEAPARRFLTEAWLPRGSSDPTVFRIPAGNPNWASPPVEVDFKVDAELVWMMPHMHARGKDMTYRIIFPDGRSQIVLSVPRYDFNWQIGYEPFTPIKLPKGSQLRVDAHFDNSAANRANPDATVDVYEGTQTWEEMMNPWFGIIVDRDSNPDVAVKRSPVKGG
jgi:hypothetical protein